MPTERSTSSLLSIQSYGGRSSSRASTTTNYSQSEQDALREIRQEKAALLLEIRSLKDEIADCSWIIERLDVDEDGKPNSERQIMAIGRKKFNLDPKKGLEYMLEQKVLQHTPEDVAKFLFAGEGLTKTAIGIYLGEPDAFNQKVLEDFIRLHDFSNTKLVSALRVFLWSFRLPGESQKIDRMMEKFAQYYCEQNEGVFATSDSCYVLSYATIMLNTTLHNRNVKDRQTVEQFIKMNRGINGSEDLPREMLVDIFDDIKAQQFKIAEDDGNDLLPAFEDPDRQGWLYKQGGKYKSWKQRWFVLNDNVLYYFVSDKDKEPKGIIPLENTQIRDFEDRNRQHCFELYLDNNEMVKACKTQKDGKVITGRHTTYRVCTNTPGEKEEWMRAIRSCTSDNPFLGMLQARKKQRFYHSGVQ
ncbi:Cytohesin-1 [Hypsibius exemplaris]|uniref:Cytohesin-1 n=1 Tax=Hypsibius exemplaris TaxID=2072580 RepID=A0A1W0XCW9_HYPEX|nr:Cytohesin-1 [Hypsibius exemplaris]